MKIRTQFIITIILFGIMMALIAVSAVATNRRVEDSRLQEKIANRIAQGASELSYLSNDYVIYRESQLLNRWQSRFATLSEDVDALDVHTPDQQALVQNIEDNQSRMKEVFEGIVTAADDDSTPSPTTFDPTVLQVAWSRMAVQSQGLISDSSLLSQKMSDEADRFGRINTYVIFSMIGVFGAYFLISYLLIQRRMLSAMARLQADTTIIGSGNLDHVIEEQHNDEIGDLSRAFNRMTSDLKGVTASKTELEQEILEHQRARKALRLSEYRYRSLFENMVEGFAYHRMIFDEDGAPVDFKFLEVNEAFEKLTGLKRDALIGKRASEAMPADETDPLVALSVYSQVAREGEPQRLERYSESLDKWLSLAVYSPEKDYFVVIFDDITKRKLAEEKLQKALTELEQSNSDLQQFAYVASHDLKEPLRTVSSYVQLLRKRYSGRIDEDADQFIDFTVDATRRMDEMIEDLLSYSRVGTKGKPFEIVDANQILGQALANLQTAIDQSHAGITADPLPELKGDRSQLIILFQNLVSNAIKFHGDTPPQIQISARRQDGKWRFAIRDNGIGIDPGSQERVFVIFQRLHTRDQYPGTGIGLAVCRKIVERHGGSIWVESEPGEGSTFFFTLLAAD